MIKLLPLTVVMWNTGHPYTKDGQVIGALVDGDRTWFADFSRHVAGSIETNNPHLIATPLQLRRWIEHNYLEGSQYRNEMTHQRLLEVYKVSPLPLTVGRQGTPHGRELVIPNE